jgi:hypothetical protein
MVYYGVHSERTGDTNGLRDLNLGVGDRLVSFILRLTPKAFCAAMASWLLLACLPLLVAAFERNFSNPSLSVDASHAYGYMSAQIVGPAIVALSLYLYLRAFPFVLKVLVNTGVLPANEVHWRKISQKASFLHSHWSISRIPYMVAFVCTAWTVLFMFNHGANWISPRGTEMSLAGWVSLPFMFISYYIGVATVVRVFTTSLLLWRAFVAVEVNILYPDGCGGVRPVGFLVSRLNIAVVGGGLVVGVVVWHSITNLDVAFTSLNIISGLIGYALAATVLFFMPLVVVHRRMLQAKESILTKISLQIKPLQSYLIYSQSEQEELDTKAIEQLEKLEKFYRFVQRMPVLPFNAKIVSGFVTSLASVAVPIMIKIISATLVTIAP